jgi:hypothetical protein
MRATQRHVENFGAVCNESPIGIALRGDVTDEEQFGTGAATSGCAVCAIACARRGDEYGQSPFGCARHPIESRLQRRRHALDWFGRCLRGREGARERIGCDDGQNGCRQHDDVSAERHDVGDEPPTSGG